MPAFSLRNNPAERRIARVELNRIELNPRRARHSCDEAELKRLADSIAQFGLLSPLLVRRKGSMFELIAGSRRLRALIPYGVLFVSESGVRDEADVRAARAMGADALLVGEALMRARDRGAFLSALREAAR